MAVRVRTEAGSESQRESQSYFTTDSQSVSTSWFACTGKSDVAGALKGAVGIWTGRNEDILWARLPQTIGSQMAVRLSALRTQVLVRPEGLGKLKNFIHLIGSRTRDLPACSTVP
jgi:hypothetical protein